MRRRGFWLLAAKLSGVALPVKRQEHKVYVDEVKELKAQQCHDVFRGKKMETSKLLGNVSPLHMLLMNKSMPKSKTFSFASSDRHRRHC